jgi:SET domain-containing protein
MSTTVLTAPRVAVVVKPSRIHGMGLFADQVIEADTLIGVYEGPWVFSDDDNTDHVLWVEDDDGRVYGIDGRNEMRFVNHHVDANAGFFGEELYALRRIEPGEEITHHYGDDWAATSE